MNSAAEKSGVPKVLAKYLLAVVFGSLGLAFAFYSLRFGARGLVTDLSQETYIYTPNGVATNLAIFSHMAVGALLMVVAPLQLVGRIRSRHPAVHRVTGRCLIVGSVLVALGGLAYIASRGTVAGPLMDVGFALYGALMLTAALQALRHARAGNYARHADWALRLFVLIMGSLLYRLHYAFWYLLTDGLWSNKETLDGPFDQIQYFAFYLPYLAVLEIWLRRRPATAAERGAV